MKSHKLQTVVRLCLIPMLSLWLASAVHAQGTTAPASMPHGQMHKGMMGSDDMKKSMMMGIDSMNKMPMSGDTDKDFAMMMKNHHQQAVGMSEMQLAHGKSPEMKAMAKQIISAQKKEIAKFDKFLAKQK